MEESKDITTRGLVRTVPAYNCNMSVLYAGCWNREQIWIHNNAIKIFFGVVNRIEEDTAPKFHQ